MREASTGDEGFHAAVLAWWLDMAAEHREWLHLSSFTEATIRVDPARLVYDVHSLYPSQGRWVAAHPGPLAASRGLLAPDPLIRPKILRPEAWIIEHNPGFRCSSASPPADFAP